MRCFYCVVVCALLTACGGRFDALSALEMGTADILGWAIRRRPEPWVWEDAATAKPPPRRVDGGLRVTWINHASVLIQMADKNVIADPVLGDFVGPNDVFSSGRYRPPALSLAQLPKIDAVLVSHDHFDHCDLPTIAEIVARDQPLILAGTGSETLLAETGAKHIRTMDWWDVSELGALEIVFTPVKHWSRRGLSDTNDRLWGAFRLRDTKRDACSVFFGGDTGYGEHFRAIAKRLGPTRFVVLPIGAYEPQNIMAGVHMAPWDALKAFEDLQAERGIGVHWDTFKLTDEPRKAPAWEVHHHAHERRITGFSAATHGVGYALECGP